MSFQIEWVEILAIIAGPILAVQAQVQLDKIRRTKSTKTDIFKTLMATRATKIDPNHVQALNRIDLEFKDETVLEYLKQYKKKLNNSPKQPDKNSSNDEIQTYQSDQRSWEKECQDIFINLLESMSKILKYKFKKTDIEDGIYYPDGLARIEQENQMLRWTAINFFTGHNTAKFGIEHFPHIDEDKQIDPLDLKNAISFISKNGYIPVKVIHEVNQHDANKDK